ncbi:MAG: hypothetical protein GYA18_02380 [Chloroflexi bacterium]|nr:hypothetical protein [Chloroflexota bacterium]
MTPPPEFPGQQGRKKWMVGWQFTLIFGVIQREHSDRWISPCRSGKSEKIAMKFVSR